MKKLLLISFLLITGLQLQAQTDSVNKPESTGKTAVKTPVALKKPVKDSTEEGGNDIVTDTLSSTMPRPDSLSADTIRKATAPIVMTDTSTYRRYETHPWLPLQKAPVFMIIDYRKEVSKDDLFYLLAGVVLILAFIRAAFSKYFRNLFLLFFQTSLRQKQTRDQLLQDNLASLLMNLLFVISAGLFITLLIQYKQWIQAPFWWLAGGSAAVLLSTYLVKYLFLLFAGWVFNTKEAAGSYVFVVFLVNKVLGVLLIPLLLILAFSNTALIEMAITLSAGVLLILILYRYWVSFLAIRSKLKVNALHFFLYLCAVELLPLVLIYKVLINYLDGRI